MGYYFDDSQSINAYEGTDPQAIISSLAYRYMGQNLKHGLYYRAYTNNGIVRTTDYRYLVDFNKIFPDSKDKECVWAFTKFYSAGKSSFGWDINCFGPMVVYVNGEVAYKSDIFKERYSETSTRVFMDVEEGWNDIRIQFKKTKAGFGGQFGTWIGKWDMYTLMPTKERDGQEGFVFTELVPDDYVPEFEIGMSEKDFDKKLYPIINWSDDEMKKGQLTRMFGTPNGQYAVGYTKVFADDINNTTHKFTLDTKGETVVYIDKKEVFKTNGGKETFDAQLPLGTYDVYVKCICGGNDWGYTLECDTVEFESAARVKGTDDVWMYIGTFVNDFEFPFDTASDMLHIVGEPATYWRLDAPDTFVRPYNENTLFGRWNYPLGVTMYGLLHTAIAIGSEDIKNYIKDHVQLCIDTLEYALWDKEQYGGATSIHNLLTSIDSLDDCGSFASMMLEVNKYLGLRDVKKVADYVGDYIYNHQSRLEDGTFFRKEDRKSVV